MMSKALLPTIVDGVKDSLISPALSEPHGLSQAERFTGLPSGPTKGNSLPSTTSGSQKGLSSPSAAARSSSGLSSEPHARIASITLDDDTNNESVVTDARDQQEYDPLEDDDILESSFQRWQATEELSALLNACFVKPLSGFEKR